MQLLLLKMHLNFPAHNHCCFSHAFSLVLMLLLCAALSAPSNGPQTTTTINVLHHVLVQNLNPQLLLFTSKMRALCISLT